MGGSRTSHAPFIMSNIAIHVPLIILLIMKQILATAALLFIMLQTSAFADECLPDCFEDHFGPPSYANVYLAACSCTVTVKYSTRFACGLYHDVYIEAVYSSGCDIWTCVSSGYGNSIKALLDDLTEQLLILNPMGFPPLSSNDPCEDNWRVMHGSCWAKDVLVGMDHSDHILHACTTNYCCLERFTVCWENGARVITQTAYQESPDPTCGGNANSWCQPVCGSIYRH